MPITRSEFLLSIATGAAFGALAACGGDDGGGGIDAPPGACVLNENIGGNHGHVLVVTMADVTAAANKTYDITGSGGHTHMVTLTAAHFAMLAANQTVMATSTSGDAHTHTVTVTC